MSTTSAIRFAAAFTVWWLSVPLLSAPPTPIPGTRIVRTPFRLLFQSYDGDPKKAEALTFQVITIDLRQRIPFLKLGDTISNTKLKLSSFKHRIASGPNFEPNDASELSLINTETHEQVILVMGAQKDIPTTRYITLVPAK